MTATRNNRKRPSKAAIARLREEVEARPKGRELPLALKKVVEDYNPARVAASTMTTIKPFLLQAITVSTLEGEESVRKHCNHLTELATFAIERGVTLEVDRVLTTTFIDEYIRVGMAEQKDPLRAQRRTRLLALARIVNPGPDVPARLTPVGHSAIKASYSPTEIAVIVRAAKVQPTEARMRDLACVVALGAGAGLDSIDMRDLFTDHVEDHGEAGILIHVQGPRPRVVPLRFAYEDLLRRAIAGRATRQLLLGQKQDRRNTAARATERAALYKVPHIEPARLRATWLADLMTDSVPLAVILRAAGLKSARTLSELQPHLGPWLTHKGLTMNEATVLRGETR
jgi:hypothetical protein